MPKFCKLTQLFVQVYIAFYSLRFKLEMMNILLKAMNINKVSQKGKEKVLSNF